MNNDINKKFNENLSIIRGINPYLFEQIESQKYKIKIIPTKNGLYTFEYKGIYIESRVSPGNIVFNRDEVFGGSIETGKISQYIFLGSGLSYHIHRFLNDENSKGVLIERETDIFIASLFVFEPHILRKLTLIIGKNYEETIEEIKNYEFDNIKIIRHPFSTKFNKAYYDSVENYIKDRVKEEIASSVTTKAQVDLWRRNTLRNMINIKDKKYFTTGKLLGKFKGPVLLVASGPSVDNVIGKLKRLKKYLPIIALLPSMKLLKNNDIIPDALFTTDPGFWNKERFIPFTKIPLFTTYSVNPLIPRNWLGEVFYFSHGLDIESEFYEIVKNSLKIPMQGTSAIVMILFARLLGFNPIYLAGYDFCNIGLKEHHTGAGFDSYLILNSRRDYSWYTEIIKRIKNEGLIRIHEDENVYTTYKLILYKNWLEKWIVGKDLFNISEIWPIKGVRKIDLKDVENEIKNVGISSKDLFNKKFSDEKMFPIAQNKDLKGRLDSIIKKARHKLTEEKNKMNYIDKNI